MPDTDEVGQWWIKALLGEAGSAYPLSGRDVKVSVDGNVVTLTGTVATSDQAEDLEAQAASIVGGRQIVNRITVSESDSVQHLQTIIGIYPSEELARLACQVASSWKWRPTQAPEVVSSAHDATERLRELTGAAKTSVHGAERYLDAVRDGKSLLIDRVPEDDAFRVISGLEGTSAETIHTLPPEPDSVE